MEKRDRHRLADAEQVDDGSARVVLERLRRYARKDERFTQESFYSPTTVPSSYRDPSGPLSDIAA